MTEEEAIAALDAIDSADPEAAHGRADNILLELVSSEVHDAYMRVVERTRWWAFA